MGGEKNPTNMVTIAQLAERRIVVPNVVGSSPTSHPKTNRSPRLPTGVNRCCNEKGVDGRMWRNLQHICLFLTEGYPSGEGAGLLNR